jgi:hypothetical protein
MTDIRLKMVESAQFKFDHFFGRISFNLDYIRPMAVFFVNFVIFEQFGNISTNFSVSSNKKLVVEFKLRVFYRF